MLYILSTMPQLCHLMKELKNVNSKFNILEPDEHVRTSLYGDKHFDNDSSGKILKAIIRFVKQTQRFQQAYY